MQVANFGSQPENDSLYGIMTERSVDIGPDAAEPTSGRPTWLDIPSPPAVGPSNSVPELKEFILENIHIGVDDDSDSSEGETGQIASYTSRHASRLAEASSNRAGSLAQNALQLGAKGPSYKLRRTASAPKLKIYARRVSQVFGRAAYVNSPSAKKAAPAHGKWSGADKSRMPSAKEAGWMNPAALLALEGETDSPPGSRAQSPAAVGGSGRASRLSFSRSTGKK